jgi:UDP-N-acetylmuramoyl-tripeptide--D-alanyl-D-alanine ligase
MNGPAAMPAPMMDLAEAARAVSGTVAGPGAAICGVCTDSRTVVPGDLFVALVGERHDGHDHVAEALRRGAAAALVSRAPADATTPRILVDDTKAALGRLAAAWRSRFSLPVAALTGSNGKTTVKEMVAAILAAHCGGREDVLATVGNLNNDIGLPLMLLRLREHHRYAVLEMGMNHAGEIDYLSRLAAPDVALVNNAQRAHVGLLGGLEAVARAKGEIYAHLATGGTALVNADDAFAGLWRALAKGRRMVTFGTGESADVRGQTDASGGQLRLVTPLDAFAVTLRVPGAHNARNAIAACAMAFALEVPWQAMQTGLERFAGSEGRLQRRRAAGGAAVIDDTYNANPDSMRAAVDVLAAEPGRRVLVMGDMGELGAEEAAMHAEVGAFARDAGIDALLALGPLSARAADAFGAGAAHFADVEALAAAARAEAGNGATLLVKGSRFMRMERVVAALVEERDDAA